MFDAFSASAVDYADNADSGFSPKQINGLVLWLKADAGTFQDSAKTTPATADLDPVGAWADQSASGNDIIQATAGNRAVLNTNVQNGMKGILFSGASHNLQKTFGVPYAQPNTVVVTFKSTLINNTGPVFDALTSQNEQLDSTNWGVSPMRAYSGTVLSTVTNSDVTNFHIASVVFNGGSGVVRYNKAQEATGAIGALNLDGFTLGSRGDSTTWFVGYILEIAVYNAALTTAQMVLVENYMATRYAL